MQHNGTEPSDPLGPSRWLKGIKLKSNPKPKFAQIEIYLNISIPQFKISKCKKFPIQKEFESTEKFNKTFSLP